MGEDTKVHELDTEFINNSCPASPPLSNLAINSIQIRSGDALVGLPEDGFVSSDIEAAKKALYEYYGPNWRELTFSRLGSLTLGKLIDRPPSINEDFVIGLSGGYGIGKSPRADIHGTAQVIGCGLPSKLRQILEPMGFGAVIDNPMPPPAIMLEVQNIKGYSDQEAYSRWHMGTGMVVITSEPDTVINQALAHDIWAREIGKITEDSLISIKLNTRWIDFWPVN